MVKRAILPAVNDSPRRRSAGPGSEPPVCIVPFPSRLTNGPRFIA
jgi:hypothetical protein